MQTSQRDYNEELRYQNEAINAMKKEMDDLRTKIRKTNTKEVTTAKRITNLDEEIALVSKLIQSLKNEEQKTKNRVQILEKEIKSKEEELELLKLRYEQRVVNTYMRGRLSNLEKVLSSTSWRQAVYRTQYLKVISEIEQEMTKQIESLLIQISKQKLELESVLRNNLALKREKRKQMN